MNLFRFFALTVGAFVLTWSPCLAQEEGLLDEDISGPIEAPIDADAASSDWGPDEPFVHGVPASEYYRSTVRGVWGGPPLEATMQRHEDMALSHTDPVSGNGELVLQRTDVTLPGFGIPFEFRRTYRSRVRHQGSLGFGWAHNYDRRISPLCAAGVSDCFGDVTYQSGSLERILFRPNSTSETAQVVGYAPDAGIPLQLFRLTGPVEHRWLLVDGSGVDAYFDGDFGTLSELKDAAGNKLTITWVRDANLPDGGMIDHVTDTAGRVIYFVNRIHHQPNGGAAVAVQLQCISLENKCSSPLVSFEMSSNGQEGEEFDLIAVHDAMGRTQSFDYYRLAPSSDLSIDDESLGGACHLLCDPRTNDPSTWQNSDMCEAAVQDVLKFRCDFADAAALPILFHPEPNVCNETGVPCHPHSLQTTDGKLLPWLDQAPMILDLANGRTLWEVHYPGFRYCTETCVAQPLNKSICTSDVFPDCPKLSQLISGPEGDVLQPPDWLYYREACHCILATNQTFCSFHPDFADCSKLIQDDAAIGVSGNMMSGYAAACHAYFDPVLHAANVGCPAKCTTDCMVRYGAHDAAGLRRYAFGAANDLDHNLTDVFDGEGRLVLHTEYGLDRFNVSYDRVVRQRLGDAPSENEVSIAYHNLVIEQQSIDGTLPVLEGTSAADYAAAGLPVDGGTAAQAEMARRQHAVELDPPHVTPTAAFGSVDICPQVCTEETPVAAIVSPLNTPMFPIATLSPAARRALGEARPLILRAVNDREVEVQAPAVERAESSLAARRRGKAVAVSELAHIMTRFGAVSFKLNARGSIDFIGNAKSIDSVFGAGGAVELISAAGGHRFIRPVAAAKHGAFESAPIKARSGFLASLRQAVPNGGYREDSILGAARAKASLAVSPRGGVALPEPAAQDALGTELARAGVVDAFARLVIRRTGPRTGALPPAAPVGAELGAVVDDDARVMLKASAVPLRWTVDGGVARLFGKRQEVVLFKSDRNTWAISSVPGSDAWLGDPHNGGLISALRERVRQHPPQVCTAWSIGDAAPHVGAVDAAQIAKYAAVVTDPHGVTHTQYFDGHWRVVRDVNLASHQQIDRNYFGNGGSCTRYPAGDRLVLNADTFGRVTQLTQLPAKGFLGNAVAQTTRLEYAPNGTLTREVKALGTADESTLNLRRDPLGRLHRIELGVHDKPLLSFDLEYVSTTAFDPHNIAPALIRSPSGIETKFVQFDPSGGGPRAVISAVNTSRPITSQLTYDAMGRVTGTIRSKHPGTRWQAIYDRSGMITHVDEADHVDPRKKLQTTIVHNASGQVLRVENENVRTCYQFNALDQLVWIKEITVADASVNRSMCLHHGADGRMEYAVLPEGNVMVWQYRADGRLGSLQQGKPANLNQWTRACVADMPAPVSRKPLRPIDEIGAGVHPPEVQPGESSAVTASKQQSERLLTARRTQERRSGTAGRDLAQARRSGIIAQRVDACATENPEWRTDSPMAQTDLQTTLLVDYQSNGFFKSITDGAGVTTLFDMDGYGRVISDRNGLGATMWQGFDAADRVTWRAFVGPNMQPYHRPSVVESVVPLLAMAEYQYDFAGRLKSDRQWHFDANTAVNSTPPQTSTAYVYDDATRSLRIDVDGKPVLTLKNDELTASSSLLVGGIPWLTERWTDQGPMGDRIDQTVLAQGLYVASSYRVNDFGQRTSSRDANGTEISNSVFDRFGRLSQFSGAPGGITAFTYDAFDRVASWSIAGEKIGELTYLRDDTLGAVSYTNAAGGPFNTQYGYDGLNRLIAIDEPLGLATRFAYAGGSSHLKTKTDPAGTIFSFAYDAAGSLLQLSAQPSSTTSNASVQDFSYDSLGRLQYAQNTSTSAGPTNGMRIDFAYDSLGCVVSENNGGVLPVHLTRQCDGRGNPMHTTFTAQSGASLSFEREFDAFGRVTHLSQGNRSIAALSYRGMGRPTHIAYSDGALTATEASTTTGLSGVMSLSANNNEIGRFEERQNKDGTAIVRAQLVGSWHTSDAYGADDRGRLVVEAHGLGAAAPALASLVPSPADVDASVPFAAGWTRYTLDSISNWSKKDNSGGSAPYAVDALNAYSSIAGAPLTYDANHNLSSDGPGSATYDVFGRLATRTANGTSVQFAYDPLGRRVFEIDANSGKSASLIWDGGSVVGSGSPTPDASALTMLASGDPGQPLAIASQFGTGPTHFLATRSDGSTVAMMNQGHIEETYNYSGYGVTSVRRANGSTGPVASVGNRWLYHGQWQDAGAGEYLFGAREYSPQLGRFLSRDPIGLNGGINAYAFAAGEPLRLEDPNGTFPIAPGASGISDARLAEVMKTNLSAKELEAIRKVLTPGQIASMEKSVDVFKRKDAVGDVRQRVHTESTEFLIKAGYAGIGAAVLAPAVPLALIESPMLYVGTKLAVHAPWLVPLTYHVASGYIGAPTVGNLITRTVGAGVSALEPAAAAEIAPLSEYSVGPAFKTLEEAGMNGGHQAQVVLRRYSQVIATWWESSHRGSGFRGHTEQKAIARTMEYILHQGAEGLELEINGFHPPCPYGSGCMNTMQWFSNEYDVIVDYGAKGVRYIFQSE